MDVIKEVLEDRTLGPAEKVLFAILYCRREGKDCKLSVQELVHAVGLELNALRESLQHLEKGGLIKIDKGCEITDATSFLACAVLGKDLKYKEPDVPRP